MKKSIDDLRAEYKRVTKNDPAIRWNRRTLEKKILDAEILEASYAAREKAQSQPKTTSDIKPEFESLASGPEKSKAEASTSAKPQKGRWGGHRDGAGRPIDQSDERARCERLLALQVPDLSIKKICQGLNLVFGRFTLAAFTSEQIDSLALGFTLPLYYWFQSLEGGVGNKWALHFQSMELIGKPVNERMQLINQIMQQAKEQENGGKKGEEIIEQNKDEEPGKIPGGSRGPGGAGGGRTRARSTAEKRPARSGSKKK
ncbi:hypothetical protein ES705_10633 [subsurface metagenome]